MNSGDNSSDLAKIVPIPVKVKRVVRKSKNETIRERFATMGKAHAEYHDDMLWKLINPPKPPFVYDLKNSKLNSATKQTLDSMVARIRSVIGH